jgi:hypothetical protein
VRDESGKLLYYSRLEYDSSESETSRNIILRDNRYPPKAENSKCLGYPIDIVNVQYFKGKYLSAKEKRTCQQDALNQGLFVGAAAYVPAVNSPTPTPTSTLFPKQPF